MNWIGGLFLVVLCAFVWWMSSSVGESGLSSPAPIDEEVQLLDSSVSDSSPWEKFVGPILVAPSGDMVQSSSIEGDFLALYFSASWCPPCRRFLPILKEFYESSGGRVQIVLMGQDQTEAAREAYYRKSEMPWESVPFDSELPNIIGSAMGLRGIPSLVVIDREGNIVTSDGVEAVMASPDSAVAKWGRQ